MLEKTRRNLAPIVFFQLTKRTLPGIIIAWLFHITQIEIVGYFMTDKRGLNYFSADRIWSESVYADCVSEDGQSGFIMAYEV